MSTHRITPDQVRRIEDALEERKPNSERRNKEEAPVVEDGERRTRSDRRKDNTPSA